MTSKYETQAMYELTARYRKAMRLADVLEAFSGGPAHAAYLPDEGRRMAEKLAEVNPASEMTWALVVEILRSRAQVRSLTANDTEASIFGRL